MERLLDKKRLFERGRLLDHLRHTKIECQLIRVAQTHEQGSDKSIRSPLCVCNAIDTIRSLTDAPSTLFLQTTLSENSKI